MSVSSHATAELIYIFIVIAPHIYIVSGDACGAVCGLRGSVMADAAMLDAVLEMDVWGRERGADGRPHHRG